MCECVCVSGRKRDVERDGAKDKKREVRRREGTFGATIVPADNSGS